METKLLMIAAIAMALGTYSVGATTVENDTTAKKESFFGKVKNEVKKDAKVVKNGTVKAYDKTKAGTVKTFKKVTGK